MDKTPKKKYRNKWIAINTHLLTYLKQKPCMDCGDILNPWQMDFDHRPGTDKRFSVTLGKVYNAKKVLEEIAKCDLVCSNCHRNRTYLRLHPEMIPHSVSPAVI